MGTDIEELRAELKQAAKIKDFPERHIRIVLVITKLLEDLSIYPVLVGGGAVEFYTMGAYATGDIDLVAPSGKDISNRLELLCFQRMGKNWVNEEASIFLEFPSSSLGAGEDYNEIDIGGGRIRIVSIEDLIVDRLNAFKWWGSTVDGVNTLLLLNSRILNVDMGLLEAKVKTHDLTDAYQGIVTLWNKVQSGELSMERATDVIEELRRNLKCKPSNMKIG